MKRLGYGMKNLCDKYGFSTRIAGFNDYGYFEVYSQNIDGENTIWFETQSDNHDYEEEELIPRKINVYGNTKERNIYLSKTRQDLNQKDIFDFLKNFASINGYRLATDSSDISNKISIKSFVDLKDFQDIGNNKGCNEQEKLFFYLDKENEVLDKLFYNAYYIWKNYLKYSEKDFKDILLIRNIRENINVGLNGVEDELDCLREEFDKGNTDNPYYEDLDNLWDCFNWYKDYLNNDMTLENFSDLLNDYLKYEPEEIDIEEKRCDGKDNSV